MFRRYVPRAWIVRTKSGLSLVVIPAAGSYLLCLTLHAYLIPGWKCIFSHTGEIDAQCSGCLVVQLLGWDVVPSCPRVSRLGKSLVVMASSRCQSRGGVPAGGLDTPRP